jgi:ABC-type branched-subunit amino acid transport system substrate-binding protein
MRSLLQQVKELRGKTGAAAVVGLGAAAVWIVLVAIIGAIAVSGDGGGGDDGGSVSAAGALPGQSSDSSGGGGSNTTVTPGATTPGGKPGVPTPGQPTLPGKQPKPGSTGGAPASGGAGTPSPSGGDTTGVTDSEIHIGVHAPITFSGVPLNLAEDPITGIHTYSDYINAHGGINGRKIVLDIQDDRYDSEGARNSAQTLINDHKNFVVSGTLGIDQVAIVATEAAKRGVPYTAAGGVESAPIPGMFQLSASYTTHADKLADFMAKDDKLSKLKKVGVVAVDSQFVRPLVDEFKKSLARHGFELVAVVYNQKPAQNPDYNGYILKFRQAGTQVLVPLTDPLTTQQIVQRCAAGAACGWTYTFSNFAHDSDTALELFTPTWSQQKVRGLSSGCYYHAPEVDGPNCAQMKVARQQWIEARGQSDWDENGSGGASGYQIVSFLKGGLQAAGRDLTRERFKGALSAFNGYSDLITGPITFAGRQGTMHGAERMVVLEAQADNHYKMITPGFVDGF